MMIVGGTVTTMWAPYSSSLETVVKTVGVVKMRKGLTLLL